MSICVIAQNSALINSAETYAKDLNAKYLSETFDAKSWNKECKRLKDVLSDFDAALLVQDNGLSLLPLKKLMSPIYIDFFSAAWQRRLFNISSKTELAAKAAGIKSGFKNGIKNELPIHIFDANAGLGGDSFVFAALGAEVLACERSLLVFLLLQDALERAKQEPSLTHIANRITLVHEDSKTYLDTLTTISASAPLRKASSINTIYLDPMFPDKKHQALVKKEMQTLQAVLGADSDAALLFETSLNQLKTNPQFKRLVIKRPKSSQVLNEPALSRQLIGSSTRFDIYHP